MRNRLNSSCEQTGDIEQLHESNTPYQTDSAQKSYLEHQVCLFGPERYESGYDYPLVVWLHSCQSSELELENVMPELSLQNYVACAPRGTMACDPEGKFFQWGQTNANAAIAEEVVFESIDLAAQHFSVNKKKVFLAGFGSGGSMAWRVAMRYPQRFAGVISICGDFPHRNRPLLNIGAARSLPMMWLYGEESKTCGIQQVCESLPLLHTASLSVDLRQYPCGDDLLTNMLDDINGWMMELVTQQACVSEKIREESFSRN